VLAACENPPRISTGSRTLEVHGDTISLDAGVEVHDVRLRATNNSDFEPGQLTVKTGDIVRFVSSDTRTHGLVITAAAPDGASALEQTGQHRSTPIVAKGQAWIITLKNVPRGSYTVACISHAGTLALTVE
jgi:plastocyanin